MGQKASAQLQGPCCAPSSKYLVSDESVTSSQAHPVLSLYMGGKMMAFLRVPGSSFSTKNLHILRASSHKVHRGEQGRCVSSVDVRCCHPWEWRLTCLCLVFRLTETTHSGKVWEAESSLSASSRSLALTRSQEPIYTEDLMVSLLLSVHGHGYSLSQEWRQLSSSSSLDFMWGKTYP